MSYQLTQSPELGLIRLPGVLNIQAGIAEEEGGIVLEILCWEREPA